MDKPLTVTWPLQSGIKGDAIFDATGAYRYWLKREWNSALDTIIYIMLNPSEANAEQDDRAVLRCIDFAKQWGFGALEIVNLFAIHSRYPSILKDADDPIGPENDHYIIKAAKHADKIIAAWGNDGAYMKRNLSVLQSLCEYDLYCMGQTLNNHPKYPARLPSNTTYIKFRNGNPLVVASRQDGEYLVIKHNNQYALIKKGDPIETASWQRRGVLASACMKAGFNLIKSPYLYQDIAF